MCTLIENSKIKNKNIPLLSSGLSINKWIQICKQPVKREYLEFRWEFLYESYTFQMQFLSILWSKGKADFYSNGVPPQPHSANTFLARFWHSILHFIQLFPWNIHGNNWFPWNIQRFHKNCRMELPKRSLLSLTASQPALWKPIDWRAQTSAQEPESPDLLRAHVSLLTLTAPTLRGPGRFKFWKTYENVAAFVVIRRPMQFMVPSKLHNNMYEVCIKYA
jgi:hypothetical protein